MRRGSGCSSPEARQLRKIVWLARRRSNTVVLYKNHDRSVQKQGHRTFVAPCGKRYNRAKARPCATHQAATAIRNALRALKSPPRGPDSSPTRLCALLRAARTQATSGRRERAEAALGAEAGVLAGVWGRLPRLLRARTANARHDRAHLGHGAGSAGARRPRERAVPGSAVGGQSHVRLAASARPRRVVSPALFRPREPPARHGRRAARSSTRRSEGRRRQ